MFGWSLRQGSPRSLRSATHASLPEIYQSEVGAGNASQICLYFTARTPRRSLVPNQANARD